MDYEDGISLIIKANEKQLEQKAWDMWLMKFQHMDKQSFIPFSEFYNKLTKQKPIVNSTNKTDEEIIAMAEKIKKADQNKTS